MLKKFSFKYLYRIFCILAIGIGVYLAIDLLHTKSLDVRMCVVFVLFFLVWFLGLFEWITNEQRMINQQKELKMYQMYIQPLEELVKEIRARQHEFDNHLNAILNMHLTVQTYDQLVEQQSAYIREIRLDAGRKYLQLLKISDKILAGFLYSKIVNAPAHVQVDLQVENYEVLSQAPEYAIIEVVGTLVDNAFEAMKDWEKEAQVTFVIDSVNDRLRFTTVNPVKDLSMAQVGRFFEKGYSSKGENRGLGLYRAQQLADRYRGKITVSLEEEKLYVQIQL
ncbi:MAG: GHKL domain-containing protein [Lachnospiraceae bacterium]